MVVIDPDKVHRVIHDILRPYLETKLSDPGYSLSDPKNRTLTTPSVSQLHRMFLSDFPKRPPMYPVVILQNISIPGDRIDRRDSMFENKATIRFLIHCKSTTNGHNIINGLREIVARDYDELCELGIIEPKITGSTGPNRTDESGTFALTLSIECLIYSKQP